MLHSLQILRSGSKLIFCLTNLVDAAQAVWLFLWQNLFTHLYALPANKFVLQAVTIARVAATGGAVVFLRAVAERQGGANVSRFFEVANPKLYSLT